MAFNQRYPATYQLLMLSCDGDISRRDYVLAMPVAEFLYYCQYKLDKSLL